MPSSPPEPASPVERDEAPTQNGAQQATDIHNPEPAESEEVEEKEPSTTATATTSSDTSARLEAMQHERDTLRDEVTHWRQQLEDLQQRHDEQLSTVKEELGQSKQGKEHAETQYRNLLGKVNTIRSQLGERLKQDAEELEQARGRIDELESSHKTVGEENERLQDEMSKLNSQLEDQNSEIDSLRNRTSLSTTNWTKERDDLVSREAYIREEYEVAKQAMQDWEILANEERARREALEERTNDLEEQLSGSREGFERARMEAETQSSTVDGLQRALRDLQEERKRELREMVEQSQTQLEVLKKQATGAEESAAEFKQQLEDVQQQLERALPFEKEVKEKNLLIGKLRHEAVILNDHLTKALRFLKRGKPEDNVDRQLVTNHFLHFLALDRSDAKKFQVLQLIAALLGWDEGQKEQAGLVRQGSASSASSLRLPVSPFRRTPSTPALTSEFMPSPESPGVVGGKESLAELWSEFLARDAEAGGGVGGSSRRGSVARSLRSPSFASASAVGGMMSPGLGREREGSPEVKRGEKEREEGGSARGGGGR